MNTINTISSIIPQTVKPVDTGAVGQATGGFGDLLKTMLNKVDESQAAARSGNPEPAKWRCQASA